MTISARRKPGAYTEIVEGGGNTGLPDNLQTLAIVAPRTSAGTVAALVPTEIFSAADAATKFGTGSIMHRMALAAFEQFPYALITGIAVDDAGAGVPAEASVAFTGPATAAGSAVLKIGIDEVAIAIADEDTATEIAAAFKAAVNADTSLPVTADNTTGTLELTAKNDGTPGMMIGKYDAVSGKWLPEITIDCDGVSAVVTGFTSGATDPDIDDAFDVMLATRFHQIAIPYTDATNVGKLADYLDLVSDDRNQRGARGYIFMTGALADATTIAEENSKRLHLGYCRKVNLPSFEAAAAYAAMQNAEANLALPLTGRVLARCGAPDIADRLVDPTEVEVLLYAGVTPFVVGSGENVQCVRSITTYTENAAGSASAMWLDSSKIAIADYCRDAIILRHTESYSNSVIKDVHVEGDQDFVVTCDDINSMNIAVMLEIEREKGYVENVAANIAKFSCTRDASDDTRVNSKIPLDPVDPLMVLATSLNV